MMTGDPLPINVLINGRIHTLDPRRPLVSAIATVGERILAVGDEALALRESPACGGQVYDLEGRCVLPGLTDSHIHFMWYTLGLHDLDLTGCRSLDEMVARLADRVRQTPPGQWIRGRRWDQETWPDRRFPTAADLDAAAPHHPVVLIAKSGHAAVANSQALRQAGITAQTPDPPGGRIGRDAAGVPNGMLFEDSAMGQVLDILPPPDAAQVAEWMQNAFPHAWRVGLTTIHDVDAAPAFEVYQRLYARGKLGLRVAKYLAAEQLDAACQVGLRAGLGDHWLRVAGIKVFSDGALGPRTAAMLAPYEGEPDNRGVLTIEEAALRDLAVRATACGLPLAVHAIGDRANRMVLDVLSDVGGGLSHRIEHVQLLHPDDVPRLASLGITASMQPIHATQDCEMAERYWGTRCATAYAWRSLLETGAVLAFGSDCPVEDLNPFLGIHAAVTRRRPDGFPSPSGWHPEQCLTVPEAVQAYTVGPARSVGAEGNVGTLSPGKLADLIVLDRDIFTCEPMEIAETSVLATMIGGQFVYGVYGEADVA